MAARELDFDVIVVGGGPAGCAAAMTCAQGGLRVTLIEREEFPRFRPGETLHPGVESILRQLGLEIQTCGFLRHPGNWVRWPSSFQFQPFGADENGPWLGFQAWRSTLDCLLLNRARELGVRIQQPCRIHAPIIENARVGGVQISGGAIRAQFVIDAAGSNHWLARKLHIAVQHYSPRLLARFGYMRGECSVRDEAPAIVAINGGWVWTARVGPHQYHWTRLSWLDSEKDKLEPPEEFACLEPDGPTRVADVTWRMATAPAGKGYFLTGDSVFVLDPASSHGVLKALMSGMMAAHLIKQIVADEISEIRAVHEYDYWISNWFTSDIKRLREMYRQLPDCDWI